ncbi:MAG TPA: YqzL family protein [Limnochordia bacterium]|nr:YqzL family protein [Limnochordia bacterium]
MELTPQLVWQMFLTTGSVSAYLLYRQLLKYNSKGVLH